MRIVILLLSCLWLATAHAQQASPSAGCFPLEVDFTPPSGGDAFWDFGDGASSTLPSPTHVYTGPGTYTVSFFRGQGGPLLGTTTVRVFPKPIIDLVQDSSAGCAPLTVNFEADVDLDAAIAINSYQIAYGDGTSGTGPKSSHTYSRPGTYDVSVALQTSLATCNVTEIFEDRVEVFAQPTVRFVTDPSPAQSCTLPLLVNVSNRSVGANPLSYTWDFGNGDTSNDESPDPATYTRAGSYTITLSATDANGCSASFSVPVTAGPPNPDFDLPDTVCINEIITINALGAADVYTFTYGPGINVISGGNLPEQGVQFTQPGFTTVALQVDNTTDGCSADTTRNIFVQELMVDAESDPEYSCDNPYTINYRVNNTNVSAFWNFPVRGAIYSGLDTSITYAYNEGGEYGQNLPYLVGAAVTITSPQGCTASAVLIDTVDVPNALFVPDIHEGCAPLTVTFADSNRTNRPITDVVINWGDGTTETVATSGPWQHTYQTPGEYEAFIAIENSLGCSDTSYAVLIQVGEMLPTPVFAADLSSTCPGDTLTFTSAVNDQRVDAIHFEVEGGASHHCYDEPVLQHVLTNPVDGPTLDVVFSVEYNGCITTASESYNYVQPAIADLDYKIECDMPFDVRFYANSSESDFDSLYLMGITDTTYQQAFLVVDSLDVTMPAKGAYQAVLVADNSVSNCGPSTDTMEYYITEPEAVFQLPPLICAGAPLPLDGSQSIDVNAGCSKGYQWDFTFRRPYVTSSETVDDVLAMGTDRQTVSLIVEDINGCVDTTSQDIRIFNTVLSPSVDNQRVCLPATLNFTLDVQSDTTITDYMWDFGGLGTSTSQNPTFTIPANAMVGDQLVVTVMTTDELDCPGQGQIVIEIYEPVSQVFTDPLFARICVGESILFEATDFTAEGSSLTFDWDFGNGVMSTDRMEVVTYNSPGDFLAELVYTEQATGCQGDTTIMVEVQEPPMLDFSSSVDGQNVVCFPEIITFTNTSTDPDPFTPVWAVNGSFQVAGNEFVVALDRGVSTVSLVGITSAGCSDTISRDINLVGPEGDFTFAPNNICVGTDVTFSLRDTVDVESWTWDFGNGVTQSNTDPAVANYDFRPPSGFTIVSVTFESAGGECTFTAVDTLRFDAVVAGFITDDSDSTACDADVMFIDQSVGATSYMYDFGVAGTSTDPSPNVTFPGPGEYTVSLIVSNTNGSCQDTAIRQITVLDPLNLMIDVDDVCQGQEATITIDAARDLSIVQFTPSDLIASSSGNVYTTRILTDPEVFSVVVVDSFNCEQESEDFTIDVGQLFDASGDTIIILGGSSATLNVENPGGFTFNWLNPEPGCASCDNPTVTPEETTTYELQVITPEPCNDTLVVSFLVIVAPPPIVPNLFTPNGDGTNDNWGPLFAEGVIPAVETYQVYSRWGTLVFEANDAQARWMGDKQGNGNVLPSDVYAYVLKMIYPNGDEFNAAGEVTLLR